MVRNRHLLTVSAYDASKLLTIIDRKKSTGIDEIRPKLIKLSAKVFSNLTPSQLITV